MKRKTIQMILWVAEVVTGIAILIKDTIKGRNQNDHAGTGKKN